MTSSAPVEVSAGSSAVSGWCGIRWRSCATRTPASSKRGECTPPTAILGTPPASSQMTPAVRKPPLRPHDDDRCQRVLPAGDGATVPARATSTVATWPSRARPWPVAQASHQARGPRPGLPLARAARGIVLPYGQFFLRMPRDLMRATGCVTQGGVASSRSGLAINFPADELRMMSEPHDPLQLVKQLRQILAANKLPVGFFLGAGCPCSILIPREDGNGDVPLISDIQGLTETVSTTLSGLDHLTEPFCRLIGILKEDGSSAPNVELMLSRIRSLRDAAGTQDVRGLSAESLKKLDQEICKTISKAVTKDLPHDINLEISCLTPYNRKYEEPRWSLARPQGA